MGVERYGSKTDVVVKLVLVFCIALLSFSVGTFVGKKFSYNQYKLSKLEPHKSDSHGEDHNESEAVASHDEKSGEKTKDDAEDSEHGSRHVASVDEAHGGNSPKAKSGKALSDEEIANLAQEFVADDKKPETSSHGGSHANSTTDSHGETHAKATSEAHGNTHEKVTASASKKNEAAHQANDNHGEAPLKPAERMAHGNNAVLENSKPTESRIPAALPKEVASSAIGKYTVQIAAYTTEKEAQAHTNSLKEKGFSAFYVTAKVKNVMRYRVSVGLFATEKEAKAYMKDLIDRKKVDSAFVQLVKSAE